ncbi:MAG: methylated-DNA--[protein]-cysteine S-methyltransferase [Clostridiaceae bacterium]|nr:methylated-DNA--[protein]-cysteine S-methyltransferase [Eubacteriales bacterium]
MEHDKRDFYGGVYALVKRIPAGYVTTYGQLALALGRPRASRIVGGAMSRAPQGLPCHRVVNRLGELSPPEVFGPGVQKGLLMLEGVPFLKDGRIDLKRCLWIPKKEI